ncbi:MAG: hypothetical protein MUC78_07135 [Bacteroidales bacterium]|jgi:hypothetical protein|nr:hypothetical protein [Bacteroidales bacterium]
MRRTYLLVTLISLLLSAKGQEINVTSLPDTTSILIGDQTGFTVSATIPAGIIASLSSAADTLAGKIIILGKPGRDTILTEGGDIMVTDRYLITAFDSGNYEIPPFYVEVISGDSLKRFYSDYSFIKVERPAVTPADTTDVIFDIVPPRDAPVTFGEILPWLIIAAFSTLLFWLLARFLPRNPLRRFVKPQPPREPAHVIALRELNSLKEEELWQKGEIKHYYSRLSDIMRRYIDNRYGIMSPELTTDETVRMLHKASVLKQNELSLVKELLSLSDMVKFAKYLPGGEMHEISFNDAMKFVDITREPDLTAEDTSTTKGGENA